LFTDVSDAFYLYLSFQKDLEILDETRQALSQRVEELDKRQRIGKSRLSETASTRSRLLRTEALIESARGMKEVSSQLLEFLIGQTFDRLVEEDLPADTIDAAQLLLKVDKRADVIAAQESFAAYKNNITVARSTFLPSVILNGNAYTKRADAYEGNGWDATVGVNVPLFNGFNNVGQLKQAKAQAQEAYFQLSLDKRNAIREIRTAYSQWDANQRRVKALDLAVAAAGENYKLQVDDFARSLVNNLDVLQALEDLQSIRGDQVSALADLYRSYWALKVAAGDIAP
jgi:outer membrane protein TolC